MHCQKLSEKFREGGHEKQSKSGAMAIIICQHLLLWASVYVLASSVYVMERAVMERPIFVSTISLLITACVSMVYIVLHNATTHLSHMKSTKLTLKISLRFQQLSRICILLSFILWLLSCGLIIAFTIARNPFCVRGETANVSSINTGLPCHVQRGGICASLIALTSSSGLFLLMCKIPDPFRCHLFGMVREQSVLPLSSPYKTMDNRPIFSDMSFKCRSSTSLSPKTLVASFSDSRTNLLDGKFAENGQGIVSQKSSPLSFLGPRPSLSSIRSYTAATSTQPPSSHLPPLPAYFPGKSERRDVIDKAINAPPRPARYARARKERTLRIVPPSPTVSTANIAALNQSQVSLSSIYSQDVSGRRLSTLKCHHVGASDEGKRARSSDSSSTVLQSRIGPRRLIEYAGTLGPVSERPSIIDEKFDSDIDDAATLQARLPSVRTVSAFGDVRYWSCGSQIAANYYQRLIEPEEARFKRQRSFKPLRIYKTRSSTMAQSLA